MPATRGGGSGGNQNNNGGNGGNQNNDGGSGNGTPRPNARPARAILRDLLKAWGLPTSLVKDLDKFIKDGASHIEIVQKLRSTDEYRERFKGLVMRRRNGLNAMSEAAFLQYETTARQMARQVGMSQKAIDSYIHEAVGNNVSASELGERISQGWAAARSAPKAVRDELERLYGVSEGELTEFFLDPDQSMRRIMERFQQAQLGGQAKLAGYGEVKKGNLRKLAALDVSEDEAAAGFSDLAEQQELFKGLLGSAEGDISQKEQIDATFAGDAAAKERIKRRREARLASFQGGGGAAANQEGVVGLGSSNL